MRFVRGVGNQEIKLRPQSSGFHFELHRLRANFNFVAARGQHGAEFGLAAAVCSERRMCAILRQRNQLAFIARKAFARSTRASLAPSSRSCLFFWSHCSGIETPREIMLEKAGPRS